MTTDNMAAENARLHAAIRQAVEERANEREMLEAEIERLRKENAGLRKRLRRMLFALQPDSAES